jgi:intein-encoded DNA endonuclease-like protein
MYINYMNKLTEEVLYLLGALRDGNIDIRTGKNYEIKIGQKCEGWLEKLKEIVEKSFRTKTHISNHLLRITNKESVMKIKELSDITTPQEVWNTPRILQNLDSHSLIPYIRGFWDAEGGLPKNPEVTKKSEERYISFHQKNRESLEFIRRHLINLGFHPTKITICGKVFEFRICRRDEIKKFWKIIGSWHPEKRFRLEKLVSLL